MSDRKLRRYTTLPFLLDILYEKRLPLLDPSSWDDKNDAYFMAQYKEKKKLRSVLAICFADSTETYHHWKIYAGNSSGACIVFHQRKLLSRLKSENKFKVGAVQYPYIDSLERDVPPIDDLPFIKRRPFVDEHEHRVIYEDSDKKVPVTYISITSSDIERIIINPWVNKSVFESVKAVIKSIEGFRSTTVFQSTILENEKWKKIGNQVFATKRGELKFIDDN
jgi:hypothetical protein